MIKGDSNAKSKDNNNYLQQGLWIEEEGSMGKTQAILLELLKVELRVRRLADRPS